METNRPIYIILEDTDTAWVKEYVVKKFKKELVTITRYPESITKDPLNHKMVAMEEEGEVWYELIWGERPIIPEE